LLYSETATLFLLFCASDVEDLVELEFGEGKNVVGWKYMYTVSQKTGPLTNISIT